MKAIARIALPVLAAALLLGCSRGPTTAPGPLGEVDLASKLPAGVMVPAEVKSHDAKHSVCPGGKEDEPVGVRVRWKTFTKDGGAYVSSYAVDVEKPAPGVTVKLGGAPTLGNANQTAGGPFMGVVSIPLRCTRTVSRKLTMEEPDLVYVRGDGVSSTRAR